MFCSFANNFRPPKHAYIETFVHDIKYRILTEHWPIQKFILLTSTPEMLQYCRSQHTLIVSRHNRVKYLNFLKSMPVKLVIFNFQEYGIPFWYICDIPYITLQLANKV